ncbi:MAG: hypothetical protein ACRDV0_00725 [Acidimicrobiales bacterium]
MVIFDDAPAEAMLADTPAVIDAARNADAATTRDSLALFSFIMCSPYCLSLLING